MCVLIFFFPTKSELFGEKKIGYILSERKNNAIHTPRLIDAKPMRFREKRAILSCACDVTLWICIANIRTEVLWKSSMLQPCAFQTRIVFKNSPFRNASRRLNAITSNVFEVPGYQAQIDTNLSGAVRQAGCFAQLFSSRIIAFEESLRFGHPRGITRHASTVTTGN